MQRVENFAVGDRPQVARGGVLTVGVFDGVHVGHQTILHEVRAWAKDLGGPAGVLTFSIHPDVILRGRAPKYLISLEHRLRLFARLEMDYALALPFSERVRSITAEDFSKTVFRDALGIRGLVLGHDTTIGKNREGGPQRLTELGHEHGYLVRVIGEVMANNEVVSSTRIREALEAGDLEFASNMLGRPVSLLGKVVPGDGRGRTLGFATANLDLEQEACPRNGVYAARVLIDGDPHPRMAVCNVGTRPTFDAAAGGLTRPIVEAHLLDFAGDLYDKRLELVLVARLRDERRFPGKDALVAQIEADVRQAREILANSGAAN